MIPFPTIYLVGAAAVVGLVAGGLTGWGLRDMAADNEAARLRLEHAEDFAAWERAARASEEAERAKERARQEAVNKETEDAKKDAAVDARRTADLRAANGRLLDHVARLAAYADQGCSNPPAAAGSAPAAGPGMVLADLYRGADSEASELAAAFDGARRAGLACERVYDAVRATQ